MRWEKEEVMETHKLSFTPGMIYRAYECTVYMYECVGFFIFVLLMSTQYVMAGRDVEENK